MPEILPAEVLEKMHAPPKSDDPIATADALKNYDGIIFGVPTRFGKQPCLPVVRGGLFVGVAPACAQPGTLVLVFCFPVVSWSVRLCAHCPCLVAADSASAR